MDKRERTSWRYLALFIVLAMTLCFPTLYAQAADVAQSTIKLSAKKLTIYVGKTKKLKVTTAEGDKVVKFKSSKPSIAYVNSSGKIRGKKAGEATITVKLKSGLKAKCKVTVKKKSTKKKSTKKKSSTKSSSSSSGGGKVYWVSSGKVYHSTRSCPTLSRSKNIHSGNNPPSGRRKCKVCW